jgi:hypothetical protein
MKPHGSANASKHCARSNAGESVRGASSVRLGEQRIPLRLAAGWVMPAPRDYKPFFGDLERVIDHEKFTLNDEGFYNNQPFNRRDYIAASRCSTPIVACISSSAPVVLASFMMIENRTADAYLTR